MIDPKLDYTLISDTPAPLFMGELPRDWTDIPARIVVNLCGAFPWGEPFGRLVFSLPMLDAMEDKLMPDRAEIERFVDAVHGYAEQESTYWHCHAGLNRSGLCVATYLHRHRGMAISDAIHHMRGARHPMVLCNSTFEQKLRTWYGRPDEQEFEPFDMTTWLQERQGSRDDWR